jgi:hypothetical protein
VANNGAQQYVIAGNRLFFQRDAISGVTQPLIDFGTIKPVSPAINPEEAVLEDSGSGIRVIVDRVLTKIDESYDIVCSNMNMENLAIMLAAAPPEAYTQSATQQVDNVHYATPGRLLKLLDDNGDPIYNLASVDAVKDNAGTTTYTAGTDYEVVSLAMGIIRIKTGGAISAAANIKITLTPVALSGNRLIKPQSASGTVLGTAYLFWNQQNYAYVNVREARVSITSNASSFSDAEHSNFTVKLSVINDLTQSIPAGKLINVVGALPNVS